MNKHTVRKRRFGRLRRKKRNQKIEEIEEEIEEEEEEEEEEEVKDRKVIGKHTAMISLHLFVGDLSHFPSHRLVPPLEQKGDW
jgi:hypothetical protein